MTAPIPRRPNSQPKALLAVHTAHWARSVLCGCGLLMMVLRMDGRIETRSSRRPYSGSRQSGGVSDMSDALGQDAGHVGDDP